MVTAQAGQWSRVLSHLLVPPDRSVSMQPCCRIQLEMMDEETEAGMCVLVPEEPGQRAGNPEPRHRSSSLGTCLHLEHTQTLQPTGTHEGTSIRGQGRRGHLGGAEMWQSSGPQSGGGCWRVLSGERGGLGLFGKITVPSVTTVLPGSHQPTPSTQPRCYCPRVGARLGPGWVDGPHFLQKETRIFSRQSRKALGRQGRSLPPPAEQDTGWPQEGREGRGHADMGSSICEVSPSRSRRGLGVALMISINHCYRPTVCIVVVSFGAVTSTFSSKPCPGQGPGERGD